jgi:hypothetical protein
MTNMIQTFFDIWRTADAAPPRDLIAAAMADQFVYADPRTDADITPLDGLDNYVGQFTTNAPGLTASVFQTDGHGDHLRAVVAFCENGTPRQHGTYVSTLQDGRIARLVGFVGAGGITA